MRGSPAHWGVSISLNASCTLFLPAQSAADTESKAKDGAQGAAGARHCPAPSQVTWPRTGSGHHCQDCMSVTQNAVFPFARM